MPLPGGNSSIPWPPTPDAVRTKLSEWDAWYSGDPDALSSAYGAARGLSMTGVAWPQDKVSQRRGGVVGKVARWFWGQPTGVANQRTKLHVPIASDIATASADLLFAEEVQLKTEGMSKSDRTRLDVVLDGTDWSSRLLESAEVAAALGGAYLRVTWDTAVADHPLVTTMHADQAVPEFRYGKLRAVTFWQVVLVDGQRVVRHLERHEPGVIEHGLYEGTAEELGRRVPLAESAQTADLSVDANSQIVTGYDGMTVSYVPNMRPNRLWRKDSRARDLGRSDYSGVEPFFDALDEVYTSWMRDIRLAKARILIPRNLLEGNGPGGGASFDLDQEVFVPLAEMAGSSQNQALQLTAQQFAIRTTEHAATTRELLSAIFRGAGYSAQTFGLADEGDATATEVNARERRSLTTREKKTRYWGSAIRETLAAVTAIDREVFSQGGGVAEVATEFAPNSQPSPLVQAQTAQALYAAQSASAEVRVRMIHADWDDKQVKDEVELIKEEFGVTVDDPTDVGGDSGAAGSFGAVPADLNAPAVPGQVPAVPAVPAQG